jgi:probable rRNA maturation factor
LSAIAVEISGGEQRLRRAATATLAAVGVTDGHLAVSFIDSEGIRALNLLHRGIDEPTDVLSFPVDGTGPTAGPRELGDVVICREHTADVTEAVVHGVLHLCGYDHETDGGEMLDLQARILAALGD